MTIFDYFLIGWLALGTLLLVATTGKPRKPMEPLASAIAVAINAGLIVWLLFSRGVLG